MNTFQNLIIEKNANKKVIKLLENNVIGTPGQGMLYKLLNVKDKIDQLINPHFISIQKQDKVIGTCCFDERHVKNASKPYKAFYVRYFSFLDKFRRKNIVVKNRKSNSSIKDEVNQLLMGKGLVDNPEEKFLFYAYVDLNNDRSRLLCEEFGFTKVREFQARLFSRFRPKRDPRVTQLNDIKKIKSLLTDHYKNHSLVDLDMVNGGKYYVIKDENDEVVAGVQCNLEHWNILDIPGFTGKIILNIIPKIPLLKQYFNKDYYFLSYDSIYVKNGYEKDLIKLFSHLLFTSGLKVASFCLDVDADIYRKLQKFNMGFMDRLQNNMIHQVIAKPINFSKEEEQKLSDSPVFISSFDIT
mgnify:CR=1 FL=1